MSDLTSTTADQFKIVQELTQRVRRLELAVTELQRVVAELKARAVPG